MGNLPAATPVPHSRKFAYSHLYSGNMEETEQKGSGLVLSPCTQSMLVTYNFQTKEVEKAIFTLYTQSDNDVLTGTDYPPRRPGHLYVLEKVNIKCCLSILVVFFSPLYMDGNIGHSISPYSSHCLALSAEMKFQETLLPFILKALHAFICLLL